MADYCDYIIHVRGSKKAALMVFATMRCADDKPISYESGTDEEYIIHFSGSCKWEPDAYCDKEWNGEEIDLNGLDEGAIRNEDGIDDFMFYPLKDMSAMFHCEIEIYECYPENEVCSFTHYKDGDTLEEEYSAIDYEYDDDGYIDDEEIEDDEEVEDEDNEEDDLRQELHDPVDRRLRTPVVRFQEHEILDAINRDAVDGQIAKVGVKVVGKVGAIANHRICADLPQFVPGHVGFSVSLEKRRCTDRGLERLQEVCFDDGTLALLHFLL